MIPMLRFRKLLCVAALLVGAVALGMPSSVDAAFKLRYSVDGGAFTTIDNGTNFITTTIDGLTVSATASGSTNASTTLMDTSVTGALDAAHTIVVETTFTNLLTQPPQTIIYAMTGSLLPSGAGTITDQDWVDSANGEFVTSGGTIVFNTGAHSPNFSGSGAFSTPTFYSVAQRTTITTTGAASISSDSNLQISTPAPAAVVLLFSGLPIAGLTWLRRRKANEQIS